MQIRSAILVFLVACGAPPPAETIAGTAQPPPARPACAAGTFEVMRCITGGMPRQTPQGPRADRNCITTCEPSSPTAAMRCAQRGPFRYECHAYAP